MLKPETRICNPTENRYLICAAIRSPILKSEAVSLLIEVNDVVKE